MPCCTKLLLIKLDQLALPQQVHSNLTRGGAVFYMFTNKYHLPSLQAPLPHPFSPGPHLSTGQLSFQQ